MDCKYCSSILGKYARKHEISKCPLIKSLYCNKCCLYGHFSSSCSQIESSCDINETYDCSHIKNPFTESMFVITDEDDSVRTALIVNGITPMTCQEKGKKIHRDFIENKKRLQEFMNSIQKTLVLVSQKNGI